MAFFQCTSDFSPLFRLLDDYETHLSRPAPTKASRCKSTSTSTTRTRRTVFIPAFDVRESNDAYHLDGELPGVDQSNIDIEFTDPQTLVVKGRTERNYTSTVPSASSPQIEARGQDTPTTSASRTPSPSWQQPTVEDDDEDDDGNVSDARSSTASVRSASSTRSTSAVIVEKPAPAPAEESPSSSSTPSTDHYWIAERSIGEFQRTFAFAARVDQDGVRAALRNGILSIVVPKEAAPKMKKIRIY
ncbi:30 kDa heat shock protein [Penicillium cataractarum]|uniref:30 kDa heat shock protein n=1 Tax=Penicillium cataractarum TaxID=2100454 RepID=A0A9W9RQJ4_9EURO|nr:30 kDa heat shock protein [Penicillium cataractarum]KAJ5364442.1 30 kDa heat shock protein [Penicillium cataractarum]